MDPKTMLMRFNAMEASIQALKIEIEQLRTQQSHQQVLLTRTIPSRSALCIGINYRGTSAELRGCIADANNIATLLRSSYGYTDITMLTDDTATKPTKQNILRAVQALIDSPTEVKTLSYSGHGSNLIDRGREEKDGRDETWVSLDFLNIVDDELFSILSRLKSNHRLYIVSDSCHSGTVFDLPYCMDTKTLLRENTKQLVCPNIYCISGCLDTQYSYDAIINGKASGAMTWSLLTSINSLKTSATPLSLLRTIQTNLDSRRFPQNPLFSSSRPIQQNVNLVFFA